MAFKQLLQTGVRSSLRLDLLGSTATVLNGPMEKINLEAADPQTQKLVAVRVTDDMVEVVQSRRQELGFRATVPERYASLHICTEGADARVQGVNEASLHVDTSSRQRGAGKISCGSVKAVNAIMTSNGADIETRKLTGDIVSMASQGGLITMHHLIANTAVLDSSRHEPDGTSAPGGIKVTTAYGKKLQLTSGGGPIELQHLDTRDGSCSADSQGGPILVRGFDGSADLRSRGGDVQVTACDNVQDLSVDSTGPQGCGRIVCAISPGALTTGVVIAARGRITWPVLDAAPAQQEAHRRIALAKAAQQAQQLQQAKEPVDSDMSGTLTTSQEHQHQEVAQGEVGNQETRYERAAEADAAAEQAEEGPGIAASAPDGWQQRSYRNAQELQGGPVRFSECKLAGLKLDAGKADVVIRVQSWVEAMKEKMQQGQ